MPSPLVHPLRASVVARVTRGKATMAEEAARVGVSRQRVHQWCRAALRKDGDAKEGKARARKMMVALKAEMAVNEHLRKEVEAMARMNWDRHRHKGKATEAWDGSSEPYVPSGPRYPKRSKAAQREQLERRTNGYVRQGGEVRKVERPAATQSEAMSRLEAAIEEARSLGINVTVSAPK